MQVKLTPRQREVLAAWNEPDAAWVNGIPHRIDRQLNSGNGHRRGMMLHGLRLVLFRLETKGLIRWKRHPNGSRYLGHGISLTNMGRKVLEEFRG